MSLDRHVNNKKIISSGVASGHMCRSFDLRYKFFLQYAKKKNEKTKKWGKRYDGIHWPGEKSSNASHWSSTAIRALLLQCWCLLQFIRVPDVGTSGDCRYHVLFFVIFIQKITEISLPQRCGRRVRFLSCSLCANFGVPVCVESIILIYSRSGLL